MLSSWSQETMAGEPNRCDLKTFPYLHTYIIRAGKELDSFNTKEEEDKFRFLEKR